MPVRPWNLSADRMKMHSLPAGSLDFRSQDHNIGRRATPDSGSNT